MIGVAGAFSCECRSNQLRRPPMLPTLVTRSWASDQHALKCAGSGGSTAGPRAGLLSRRGGAPG